MQGGALAQYFSRALFRQKENFTIFLGKKAIIITSNTTQRSFLPFQYLSRKTLRKIGPKIKGRVNTILSEYVESRSCPLGIP